MLYEITVGVCSGQPAAGGIHGFAAGISSHFVYGSHSDYGILFIYRSQLDRAAKAKATRYLASRSVLA